MPAELLVLLLRDPTLEKQDIISLGLCSEFLWLHVLQHVEKESRKQLAPWAATEIACTGSYLTDLPPPFEKEDLVQITVDVPSVVPIRNQTCLARRINWATFQKYESAVENSETAWRAAFKAKTALPSSSKSKLAQMSGDLTSASSSIRFSSADAPWILRNLTTKEYVCCRPGSGPPADRGYVNHKDAPWLKLDDVLLMRICWSQAGRQGDELDQLNRGQWAGHCFDIVALQGNTAVMENDWNDVTGAVVDEARSLLRKIDQKALNRKQPRRSPLRSAKATGDVPSETYWDINFAAPAEQRRTIV